MEKQGKKLLIKNPTPALTSGLVKIISPRSKRSQGVAQSYSVVYKLIDVNLWGSGCDGK